MRKLSEKLFITAIKEANASDALDEAAEFLSQGHLVALPTETVYGLAADARSTRAVKRIFEVKGRPAENPLIVHVNSVEMARNCVETWPDLAEKLAGHFWPGPLSIVLPRSGLIPDIVTSGGETVAVRCPAHPIIQAVLAKCAFPLAAPSANRSNRVSPTRADHVVDQLNGRIPLVLDGGACDIGIESTVIDISVKVPTLLRPGSISLGQLQTVLGEVKTVGLHIESGPAKSPGQCQQHYSPKAKLLLNSEPATMLSQAKQALFVVAREQKPPAWPSSQWLRLPNDPDGFARVLYDSLHRCDQAGAEIIVVQSLPDCSEWDAIRDRLNRASVRA